MRGPLTAACAQAGILKHRIPQHHGVTYTQTADQATAHLLMMILSSLKLLCYCVGLLLPTTLRGRRRTTGKCGRVLNVVLRPPEARESGGPTALSTALPCACQQMLTRMSQLACLAWSCRCAQ